MLPPPGSGSVRTHQMPQPLLNPHRLVQPPGGGGTRPDMRQLPRPSRVAVTAVQNKQTRVSTKIVLKIVLNIVYRQRVALGKDTRGYPLKLALNSLYGKLAQRSGSGPYHDAAAAGLVTAMTRARLIEAIAYDPEAVVIAATDGVFSLRPLPLDIGDGLGQLRAIEAGRLARPLHRALRRLLVSVAPQEVGQIARRLPLRHRRRRAQV